MWPNFSYRGVRSVQLLLLLLLLMVFSSENFGFSPPYAGIAGIGPGYCASKKKAQIYNIFQVTGKCAARVVRELVYSLSIVYHYTG